MSCVYFNPSESNPSDKAGGAYMNRGFFEVFLKIEFVAEECRC